MSLNIDINRILPVKVAGVWSQIAQKIIDFITELQRCESWEDVPLQFSRLSADSIIISVAFLGSDSCNPVPSKLRWIRDVEEPFRGTTQNPRIHGLLCVED